MFAARLDASAEAAWTFARSLVREDLPSRLVFRVRLNQSYDGHPPRPGERRYPGDGAADRAAALRRCDAATAVGELWRDGRVPEWVNVAVVGETGDATVVELVCCGRFTGDDAHLYHLREGRAPFHVLGPALPPLHDGSPFSIHTRSECWDRADLDHLARVAANVWSFVLMTGDFDGDQLRALPHLPNVALFEHRACSLGPGAMSAFARLPKLASLHLRLATPTGFRVSAADQRLDTLTSMTIAGLPPRPWGFDALATLAPGLTRVELTAAQTLWLDGGFGPSVRDIGLGAATVAGKTRLPERFDHLSVRLGQGTDEQVAALLESVAGLRTLSLRGTPVSDAILPLLERYELSHLDLVDTAVTWAALSRFRAAHPATDLLPRERPYTRDDLTIIAR